MAYPARLNCATELLDRTIEAGHRERPAIWSEVDGTPHATTYGELLRARESHRACAGRRDGTQPGNRVLLRGPNTLHMAVAWLASLKAGLVVVPTMPLLRAKELKQIIDKAQVGAALCDARLTDELARCSDPATTQFYCASLKQTRLFHRRRARFARHARRSTSPTEFTAVRHRRRRRLPDRLHQRHDGRAEGLHALSSRRARDVRPVSASRAQALADDIFCGTPPLAFTFGLGGLLCFPLRVGASTVLIERLTPETLLQDRRAVSRDDHVHRADVLSADGARSSRTLRSLQSEENRLGGRSAAGFDATALARRDRHRDDRRHRRHRDDPHLHFERRATRCAPHAIGRAVPGYIVQAVDDDMQPVPAGNDRQARGEAVRPVAAISRDERQAKFVRDGWNLPGDSVCIDADGYVFYQARADDMIVSAGYNISGPEVESVLMLHEAVAECGVIGVPPMKTRGQIVKAFVVLNRGLRAE